MTLNTKLQKLNVLMVSWRSPAMLDTCLQSLIDSFTVDASVKVVLNEADSESVDVCQKHKVEFVALNRNLGTLAVDCAASFSNAEYIVNTNDDMLFYKGWDANLIKIIEQNYPCSASCSLVEPYNSNNPVVFVDDLGKTLAEAKCAFEENCKAGKYSLAHKISYTHPIMVKSEDWFRVRGYSNSFDWDFWPGYGMDDYFPYRLWKVHDYRFRFIASGGDFVYHLGSATNNKLKPEDKSRSGWNAFITRTGMDIHQFRRAIKCFSII